MLVNVIANISIIMIMNLVVLKCPVMLCTLGPPVMCVMQHKLLQLARSTCVALPSHGCHTLPSYYKEAQSTLCQPQAVSSLAEPPESQLVMQKQPTYHNNCSL